MIAETKVDEERVQEHRSDIWVPQSRGVVFSFHSEARNLEVVTPPWLRFRILTPGHIEMREGAVIDYALKLHGIPLRWRSEIEVWEPPFRFVDVQTSGPYRVWRHEHLFKEMNGGTLVADSVQYRAPGGPLVERYIVRPDVERVFAYRRKRMQELFWKRPE